MKGIAWAAVAIVGLQAIPVAAGLTTEVVDIQTATLPEQIAVLACAGLLNRNESAAVEVRGDTACILHVTLSVP